MKRLLFVLLTILPGVLLSQVKTDAELTTDANVIRNETVTGGNTKTRIANMFQSIINSKVSLSGTYTNPDWLVSIPWTKITATPTTLSTFGITDGVPSSRTLTINGTAYDLSANRSWTITSTTTWGSITGTLSSQSDLNTALSAKEDLITFTASDFNESGQTISLDYTNGQAASGSTKGFLTSADWTTFNNKASTSYADAKVTDGTITDGATTTAPSNDDVFDALALKRDKASSVIYCAALSDNTTALTTGTNKGFLPIPIGGTVTAVYAYVLTAQTSGSVLTVDINEAGTSILGTKITLDNNETDNTTAATAATITDTTIANHARITFDIDQVGTSPAGLVGCIVLTPQ
jgi:hypothetical protein